MNKFKERTVVYDDDFYKHYEPAYDYKDHDNIPDTEVDYIIGVADVEEEMPLQEMINTITKRVAKRIVREALRNKK